MAATVSAASIAHASLIAWVSAAFFTKPASSDRVVSSRGRPPAAMKASTGRPIALAVATEPRR